MLRIKADARRCSYFAAWVTCAATRVFEVFSYKKLEFFFEAWVALGKFLGEFVYLAVEICHRWTLLSATPSFQVRKNFENRQKHQRRRSPWVGQADFGKLELNNSWLALSRNEK